MSIKRTKSKTDRRSSSASGSSFGFGGPKAKEKEPTWEEAIAGQPDSAFVAYSLAGQFAQGALLDHPAFGKGVVLSVSGRKMEVLFAACRKTLAMNTAPAAS